MSKLTDLMSFAELAKAVRMDRCRLRELCKRAGIAVRWGGTEEHPILKARLSDVERVILDNRYVPPAPPEKARRTSVPRAPKAQTYHHLVDC